MYPIQHGDRLYTSESDVAHRTERAEYLEQLRYSNEAKRAN